MSDASPLTSMTVSLPTAQKSYVREQASLSGCSTPSEYIRRLIHADQLAREQEELERKILEGLDAPARTMSREEWEELRNTLRKQLTRQRRTK